MRTSLKWVVVRRDGPQKWYLEMLPAPIRVQHGPNSWTEVGGGTNWAGDSAYAVPFDSWYEAARVAAKLRRRRGGKDESIRVKRVLMDPVSIGLMKQFRAAVRANMRDAAQNGPL